MNEKEVRQHRLIRDARYQREKRKRLSENIKKLCSTDEKAAKILKTNNRGKQGRPRLEVDQPALLSTIINTVQGTSAADNRYVDLWIQNFLTIGQATKCLFSSPILTQVVHL